MIRKNNFIVLGSIYSAGIFFLFAIVRYLFVFSWKSNSTASDELVMVRVFFSAPFLILLGLLLIVKFKERVHRSFGIMFTIAGIAWAIEIIKAFLEEAA